MFTMIHKSFLALFAVVAMFFATGIDASDEVVIVNQIDLGTCVYVTSITNDFDNDKNMEKDTQWSSCSFAGTDTIKDVKEAIESAKGIKVNKQKLRRTRNGNSLSNSKALSDLGSAVYLYLDKDANRFRH